MDIAIGGAGIGGLAAAILLAREGRRVVIYERFDAPSPVGSGLMLQETGLAVLGALGLRGEAEAAGSPIRRLFGKTQPSGRTVLDVRFEAMRENLIAVGVQRAALFNLLFEAAKSEGVSFEGGKNIRSVSADGHSFVFEGGAKSPRFDLLIDALGANAPLTDKEGTGLPFGALWATVPWPAGDLFLDDALEQRYRAARQMTGMMPSGQGTGTYFWSLRADDYERWRNTPIEEWRQDAAALWPATEPVIASLGHDDLTFARYRHRTASRPVEGALIHLGDSWHATSPQLGQGANMALLDAYALAYAMREGGGLSEISRRYVKLRRGHIRLYQAMSYLFTPIYQSESAALPFLRDWLAAPLSRIPPAPRLLAAIVSGALGSPLASLSIRRRDEAG